MIVSLAGMSRRGAVRSAWLALCCAAASVFLLAATAVPAAALSEIQREELPAPDGTAPSGQPASPDQKATPPEGGVPSPEPAKPAEPANPDSTSPDGKQEPPAEQPATPEDSEPEGPANDSGGLTSPRVDPNAPLPEVVYDLGKLPEPVRRMHNLIVEACKSGDIEKLRPLIGSGDSATQLSLADIDGDPVTFLKGLSGDSDGQEILAILEEVLDAGFAHLDAGTPQELYVWPYFFAMPLDRLDAKQRVELFKIVTAGDYDDMKQFGAYIFYRVGITPDGHWSFFVAGD